MRNKELTQIALNVALLSVLSQITVPIQPIPFTLQMFGIYFISFIFNSKITLYSLCSYLLLGLIGLPIFSQFKSGLLVITSPTIGFLIAFPLVGFINAALHKRVGLFFSFIVSSIILYSFGISGIQFVFKYILKSPLNLYESIFKYALIFIPTDLITYIFSYNISLKLNKSKFSL